MKNDQAQARRFATMDENPYQSPRFAAIKRETLSATTIAVRVIAIVFWLIAASWVMTGLLASISLTGRMNLAEHPIRYPLAVVLIFILPSTCLILAGLAIWLKRYRLVIYGVASLIPTVVVWVVNTLYRMR
jgi:hypothetical protein